VRGSLHGRDQRLAAGVILPNDHGLKTLTPRCAAAPPWRTV
jgi:hypothetical protein